MAVIVTRITAGGGATVKNAPLTAGEIDTNFINLNTSKAELVSPSFTTPALGTPSAGVLTNCTGTATALTAGAVITNANLSGVITSVGNVTYTNSQTGTGSTFVVSIAPTINNPILVSPQIGTPASGSLINCVGLTVYGGGTGLNTLTPNNLIVGNGTSAPTFIAPGTSGNVLTSNGSIWSSTALPLDVSSFSGGTTGLTTTSGLTTGSITLMGVLNPANGGTGSTTRTGTGSVAMSISPTFTGTIVSPQVCKAWVNFDCSTGTPSIQQSFNIASVARPSTGQYTITFTNALAHSKYVVSGIGYNSTDNRILVLNSQSTGSFSVNSQGGAAVSADSAVVMLAVFG